MGDSWKKRFSYDEMKDFLELKYEQFNNPSFIECDPVSVPYQYPASFWSRGQVQEEYSIRSLV
jgi:hypothetical protein